MDALPGQSLPPGFINYVIGSLYGHPAAAYRAKEKLHATLTRGTGVQHWQFRGVKDVMQLSVEIIL